MRHTNRVLDIEHASPPLQLVPGHEVVGVVADFGKNVTGLSKGDRVVADPGVTVRVSEIGAAKALADSEEIYAVRTVLLLPARQHASL